MSIGDWFSKNMGSQATQANKNMWSGAVQDAVHALGGSRTNNLAQALNRNQEIARMAQTKAFQDAQIAKWKADKEQASIQNKRNEDEWNQTQQYRAAMEAAQKAGNDDLVRKLVMGNASPETALASIDRQAKMASDLERASAKARAKQGEMPEKQVFDYVGDKLSTENMEYTPYENDKGETITAEAQALAARDFAVTPFKRAMERTGGDVAKSWALTREYMNAKGVITPTGSFMDIGAPNVNVHPLGASPVAAGASPVAAGASPVAAGALRSIQEQINASTKAPVPVPSQVSLQEQIDSATKAPVPTVPPELKARPGWMDIYNQAKSGDLGKQPLMVPGKGPIEAIPSETPMKARPGWMDIYEQAKSGNLGKQPLSIPGVGPIEPIKPKGEPSPFKEDSTGVPEINSPVFGGSTMSAVDEVKAELSKHEGASGDTATNVKTGKRGMTSDTKKRLEKEVGRSLSDDEAIEVYVDKISGVLQESVPNFQGMSVEAQKGLIDMAYNVGEGGFKRSKYPKLFVAAAAGDEQEVLRQTLDTATSGGKSLRGIAKRRAMHYNEVADIPITKIKQDPDGGITYLDVDNNVVMYFKARKGKHPKSKTGILRVG